MYTYKHTKITIFFPIKNPYWTRFELPMEFCIFVGTNPLIMSNKTEEIRFKNGDVYKGQVNQDGQPHGRGVMDYNLNGYYATYEGMWENGERSGKGHYYKFSKGGGARHSYDYDGEWLHDLQEGKGVETISDERGIHLSTVREVYKGGFKEGKRHGHGVIVKDNFTGSFSDGQSSRRAKPSATESGNTPMEILLRANLPIMATSTATAFTRIKTGSVLRANGS